MKTILFLTLAISSILMGVARYKRCRIWLRLVSLWLFWFIFPISLTNAMSFILFYRTVFGKVFFIASTIGILLLVYSKRKYLKRTGKKVIPVIWEFLIRIVEGFNLPFMFAYSLYATLSLVTGAIRYLIGKATISKG